MPWMQPQLEASNRSSTIVGEVLAGDGMWCQRRGRSGRLDTFGFVDVARMAPAQPGRVPLVLSHDTEQWCGEVLFLERSRSGSLWAVATTPINQLDHRRHFSLLTRGVNTPGALNHTHTNIVLHVALVHEPGAVGIHPIELLEGHDFHRHGGGGLPFGTSSHTRGLLTRAHEYLDPLGTRRRARPTPFVIHDEAMPAAAIEQLPDHTRPPRQGVHRRVRSPYFDHQDTPARDAVETWLHDELARSS